MICNRLILAITAPLLACCLTGVAQESGGWRADNSTAKSITGDIAFAPEKLSINFEMFPIARVRNLKPEEVAAMFDADASTVTGGSLYKLNIPATKKFLHRNSLCGGENAQWMAVYAAGRSLRLALFSGQAPPVFTLEAVANSTDLCGTFAYAR
jgi:hypothetical protein